MKTQQGFNLINVLIALLVFTFGMLSLAGAYLKVSANQGENEYFTSAGVLAESLCSTLSASPSLLAQMYNFSSATTQTSTALADWVTQLKAALPHGSASATATNGAGATCSATTVCTTPSIVTLTITWQKKLSHTQTYVLQVGY
jgi:Tfp pilus assembly protein PilV